METVKIELTDGTIVYGVECYNCCQGISDCGAMTEIYSTAKCGKKDYICTINGTIPDEEDYFLEYDEEAIAYANAWQDFIKRIETNM